MLVPSFTKKWENCFLQHFRIYYTFISQKSNQLIWWDNFLSPFYPILSCSFGNYWERLQVWVKTCDFYERSQVLKLVTLVSHNFWPKLVTFTKGQKFKFVAFAQSCDLSKLVTFMKGHTFKLVTFYKGHKFGPKLVTFQKVTNDFS